MMDASVALMNQYAIISASFPPLQMASSSASTTAAVATATAAATPAAATNSTEKETEPATTSETAAETSKSDNDEKTTCALKTANEAGPSTSQKDSSIETLEIDGNLVTIEDIGRNDPSDPNDPVCEVRRRRLEKFEAKSQEDSS